MSTLNPHKIKKYFKNQKPPDINELKRRKQKFTDPYFKPNFNSLISKNENGDYVDEVNGPTQYEYLLEDISNVKSLVWKRATEINPKWEIFEGKIEFDDVKQGDLGDCYYLACLSALAKYPYIIREKFRVENFNEEGYYEMIFFIDGEWQIVFVDDYFPFDTTTNQFSFTKPNNFELWAMLLEKAWAKVNGGYSNIIAGLVSEAIQTLTGFPTEILFHCDCDPMDLFKKVMTANLEGTVMSSGSKDDDKIEKKGLFKAHAYTLIDAKEYKQDDIYLLKLRNPWGNSEWKGAWSDSSNKWTNETKKFFGYEKKDDGIFWMHIDDYYKFYAHTYICYILYGSIVKTYHFEYSKYLENPAVFNIEINQKSKASISAFFKGDRFNRDLHDVIHPYVLVLCKYNKDRTIEKFYSKFTFDDDISLVEDLEPGLYVLWSYCSYKNVLNDNKFFYSLVISCKSDFKIEFVGLDQNFLFIQHLLLENYKIKGINNINSSKDYFIGSDPVPSKNGLSNTLIFNKSDKWLEVEMSISNKTNNVRHLPPYENMNNFSITIPPKQCSAVIAMRTNKKSATSYSFNINLKNKNIQIPNENSFENYLLINIENTNNNNIEGLRQDTIKYVAQDKVNSIPSFNEKSFDPKKILQISIAKTEELTKTILEKQYPFEINYLNKNFPLFTDRSNENEWDKIEIPNEGLYIGLIDKQTGHMHGKGIFIWTEIRMKYIGYINKGKMDNKGVILNMNNELVYEGQYKNGKREGKGKLYITKNEHYEGDFHNDNMNGHGIYHFEDGSMWEGEFINNKKNGVGIMSYSNQKEKYFVEYENDYFISKYNIQQNELNDLNKQKETKTEIDIMKNMSNILNINKNNKKENDDQKDLTNNLVQQIFKKKEILNTSIIQEINNTVTETKEQRIHREHLESMEKLKKDEPFMLQQVLELFVDPNTVDNFKLIVYDNDKKIRYLGNVGMNSKRHGRGAYFDGNVYYIGYFYNDLPNGYFKKYTKDKIIKFKGFLDNAGKMVFGKLFYPNGDMYKGLFKNEVADGYGTHFFSSGASWTGYFTNGVFNGIGKYFYDNGVLTELVTYANNTIVNRTQIQREDFSRNNAQFFFNNIVNSNPGVIEHLLLIPPYKEHMCDVQWVQLQLNDGSYYIGEYEVNGNYTGRCCIIYPYPFNGRRYYVGYIKKTFLNGIGSYYNDNWNLLFKGEFKDNKINGFGIEYYPNGDRYAGYFSDGLYNGLGVYHKSNGDRCEGNYSNGYSQDLCYIITENFIKRQEVKYSQGNIIELRELQYCNKYGYQKKNTLNSLAIKLLYRNLFELFSALKPTADICVLLKKGEENEEGVYVGEVNNVGFRQGRGVQTKHNSKEYYVGYFQDNLKSGYGKIYYEPNKLKYEGYFLFDKPYGNGKYYYKDGSSLEGYFNEVGEGNGIYTFPDGATWKGTFYGWFKNGNGEYIDSRGVSYGMKSYQYNNLLN